jgi:hypothetical protein
MITDIGKKKKKRFSFFFFFTEISLFYNINSIMCNKMADILSLNFVF